MTDFKFHFFQLLLINSIQIQDNKNFMAREVFKQQFFNLLQKRYIIYRGIKTKASAYLSKEPQKVGIPRYPES